MQQHRLTAISVTWLSCVAKPDRCCTCELQHKYLFPLASIFAMIVKQLAILQIYHISSRAIHIHFTVIIKQSCYINELDMMDATV